MSPPHFSLSVLYFGGFKNKSDFCYVLCKDFFMLDVTHIKVDVQSLVW